jgi:hypothetical protein
MSAITKERLQWLANISGRDDIDDIDGGEIRELARIALASLEAKPIGAFHIAEQQVDGTSDYLKDGEWPIDNGIIEVYAAPPVLVVPAALPENDDEDGHDIDYLEPSEVYALGRTAGWNACRAAMLHDKSEQPQNAQQNIPENIPGGNSPVTPDGWISRFEEMPDPSSERRVCAFTPTNHEDMRYRFVPASLFKTVCRDATHWFYMLPPVGREEVAGG